MFPSKLPVVLSRVNSYFYKRSYSSFDPLCGTITKPLSVTVIGASCKVGQVLSLLLKQSTAIETLRLYDTSDSLCGIAMDLSHIDTNTQVYAYKGIEMLRDAVLDSQIVVCCGGQQTHPGQNENDLFKQNADDVRFVAMHLLEFNPKAIFCIATPPINALVPMVSQEYKRAYVYDSRKIIGLTTLATIRANSIIANRLGKDPSLVMCPTIGGMSPQTLVPVLSQVRPKLEMQQKDAEDLHQKISCAETEILEKKLTENSGVVAVSTAFAISRFLTSLSRALKGDKKCIECAYVRQVGHIGKFLPYMTSIVKLGKHGVESTHMPRIDEVECKALNIAARSIRKSIRIGECYITGEFPRIQRKCLDQEQGCKLVEDISDNAPKEDTAATQPAA